MNKEIEKIIVKFLTHNANEKDLDKLTDWFTTKKNVLFFDHHIETNYALNMNMNKFDSSGVKKALLKKIRQDRFVFYQKKVVQYAAIALMVFGSGYFFRHHLFNPSSETPFTAPVIVHNQIETGTDKAILTLETGQDVVLTRGQSYTTETASSNGEEIVYQTTAPKELAFHTLTIPRGGQFFVALSDGTKIWLNSESKLKYPVSFSEGQPRSVELLYGEAYFEVSPSTEHQGAGFRVKHPQQDVQVLGTTFNIKAYKDETTIYTTLVEGKVEIVTPNGKQILMPHQQAQVNSSAHTLSVSATNVYNEVSWKAGVFSFNDKSLKEIMTVLARWYDMEVEIKNPDIANEKFIGVLMRSQNIEGVLSIMKNTGSINNYEINTKKVILK